MNGCRGLRGLTLAASPHPSGSCRPEDDCWRSDSGGEETGRCDDPDGLLPQRLRPHRLTALHGKPAAEMRPQHGALHQRHTADQRHLLLQQQDLDLNKRVH